MFNVNKSNGDITSIKFNGSGDLQSQTKGSHIASGLGASVSHGLSPSGSTALITLSTAALCRFMWNLHSGPMDGRCGHTWGSRTEG